MEHEVQQLIASARAEIEGADSLKKIEDIRIAYLGRAGSVTAVLRSLKHLPEDQKRIVGPAANQARLSIEEALAAKETQVRSTASVLDYSTLAKAQASGHLHPLTQVQEKMTRIFRDLNFSVLEGPELETEYYNFDALNIAPNHPARDMWDTFWIKQPEAITDPKRKLLLRTHTSPMQVRFMETHTPPFQIVIPGRVFRYEATDATHEVNFYQLEGLMVGKRITLANFKYVVEAFFQKFFGSGIEFRYRPSYFPFVEPGVEVDIKVPGKGNGWLEVLGAGMVHDAVFEAAGYNPGEWQGFAFGMGVDRLLMIKHEIPDVRMLYSGDLRVVKQF